MKDWQKEFDKFIKRTEVGRGRVIINHPAEVKSFIHSLLAEQRKEIRKGLKTIVYAPRLTGFHKKTLYTEMIAIRQELRKEIWNDILNLLKK